MPCDKMNSFRNTTIQGGRKMKKEAKMIAVIVMLLVLLSGCAGTVDNSSTGPQEQGTPAAGEQPAQQTDTSTESNTGNQANEVTGSVKLLTWENANAPFNKDWIVWDLLTEYTGIEIERSILAGAPQEAYNVVIASGDLPDIMYMETYAMANRYGEQGALINFLDHLDRMPYLKQWMDKYPGLAKMPLSAEGKMFITPNEGIGETNRTTWMYREDIFAKHNLQKPKNFDELYEVSKQLKSICPDSFPFAIRNGQSAVNMWMATAFETKGDFYYDFDENKYMYGPAGDKYKRMVEYLRTFVKEGLMPTDWLSMNTSGWQTLMSNEQSFITYDYLVRIDYFNSQLQGEKPEFKLADLAPLAGLPNGKQQNFNSHVGQQLGFTVASTTKNLDAALKLIDWTFSEEGREVLSWGKEGETYEIVDGNKQISHMYKDLFDYSLQTGLATFGTYSWYDPIAMFSWTPAETMEIYYKLPQYDEPIQPMLAFTAAEQEVLATVGETVKKVREENISKFISGVREMSEWTKHIEELNVAGLQQVLEIYQQAYDRVQ